ncbi:MAG: acyltransferase [Oscillospiraceae bacterium]|nr:acyltransferase [Oscillospiraceae bacterium]
MTVTYEAKSYSKGRTTVMGLATLLIIWFHSCITTKEGSLIWLQKYTSDIGVDMFLFASGVGVFFALKKYDRYFPYLFGRLQRVFIPFLLVAIPWFAYHDIMIGHSRRLFVKDVTMLTFWLEGRMTFWYVSAILLLYILTPAYVKLWKKYRCLNILCIAAIYGSMLLFPIEGLRMAIGPAMIFFPRIPIYLIGLSFGKAIQEERVFRVNVLVVLTVWAVCGVISAAAMGYCAWEVPTEFKYIAYGPLAVILSCACARIPANKLTDFFGKRSLEIYLLMEKVQVTLGERVELVPLMCCSALPFFMLSFVVTLILAELLRCMAYPFQRPIRWKRLDNPPCGK